MQRGRRGGISALSRVSDDWGRGAEVGEDDDFWAFEAAVDTAARPGCGGRWRFHRFTPARGLRFREAPVVRGHQGGRFKAL